MSKYDVIYILKNDYDSEELRYSLRSVVMNFPFRKIVFVGGCPLDITPDIYIKDLQVGKTKWERSMGSLKKALQDDRLTENVWIFNDDFFIMDRWKSDINYFNGSLEKRIIDLKFKNPRSSAYIRSLESLKAQLMRMRKDTLSFALHVPFLVNRADALSLMETIKDHQMFRSLYGNYYKIPCTYMEDVKVYDRDTIPDTPIISTMDDTFKNGKVGEFLRRYFDKPSKYEKVFRTDDAKEIYSEEGDVRYE